MKYIAVVLNRWERCSAFGDLTEPTDTVVVEASNKEEAEERVKELLSEQLTDNDSVRIFEYKEVR